MTWTYNVSNLSTSQLFQLRLLIGDIKQTDQQFQDEELNCFLSLYPNVYGAGAMACRALATKLSREADTVDKDLRTTLSSRATAYAKRAAQYDMQANIRGGGLPYAGGISVSDKEKNQLNTDRNPTQFNIGMDDNLIPVPPVSEETQP